MQDQLVAAQEALKLARAEAARRLGALQQMQARADGAASPAAAAAELATERAARQTAEARLQEAKAASQRKSALVADLQKRVTTWAFSGEYCYQH
jgi:hypothetical protein